MESILSFLIQDAVAQQTSSGGSEIGIMNIIIPILLVVAIFAIIISLIRHGATTAIGLVGFLIGGLLGFLLRPSIPIVGQIPFMAVITRGSNLRDADRILVSTAELSFNYLIAGAILGCCIGAIVGYFVKIKKEETNISK